MREVASNETDSWDWETFKSKLRERFYPLALQKQKESEFLNFKQGNLTITQYTNQFLELSRFASAFVGTEQNKMNRYYEGLHFKYQKLITKCDTLQEMFEQVLEKERIFLREGEMTKRKGEWSQGGSESKKPNYGNQNPQFQNKNFHNQPNQNQYHHQRNHNPLLQRAKCPRCQRWHQRGETCDSKP